MKLLGPGWKSEDCLKLPASIDDVKTRDAAISHRWLPKPLQRSHEIDLASFHGEKPSLKLMPKYEKFSTVCHLTSCKKAKRIIEDGGLAQEKRRFYSPLANKSCEVNGVDFVANTENNLEELKSTRDENEGLQVKWMIGLLGDSGIVNRKPSPRYRISDDDVNRWHHYILDITDYARTSVCRILVTPRVYHHLIPYDPTKLGGPWYWDLANDDHYCLQRVLGYDGEERALVTEFWRESDFVGLSAPGPDWSVIRDIEFIHPMTSRATNGDIDDTELLVLSWIHSQSEKFIKSLDGVNGLGKTRLQLALRDALKELPSIAKKFNQTSETNTIYIHNDAVASLAHSPPRDSLCNEVQASSSLVSVKACLGLLCQSQNLNDLREYLVGNPVSLQALFQWSMD
ncbi:hypothetical protein OS493_013475 [Desmophyllum pertusum]|uniref:Uncharacterized protein n=1 Tax=Desmophyllum pertusum TaxID=174260 RepID=A0A9X0A319_9CNID|nr:hypothetical protein OS493_013475 [Desmophyllum pertusum]